MCLVIAVDYGYTPGARLEHLATCFVYRTVGVDGDSFYGLDSQRLLDVYRGLVCVWRAWTEPPTSQAVQTELVYPSQRIWILPIILNDIYIVRGRKQTGKSG